MNKNLKVVAIVLITAMILVLPLSAQSYKEEPLFDGPTSNTNRATAGVFGNDVDDAFNVNSYAEVEFGKWFSFIHGYNYKATDGTYDEYPFAIDLGYATNLGGGGGGEEGEGGGGGLYLGIRYTGNILSMNKDVKKTLEAEWNHSTFQELSQVTETYDYTLDWLNPTNQIEALIGIAGMGIKVGFFESLALGGKPEGEVTTVLDTKDGRLVYTGDIIDSYETKGWLSPYVGWGMNLGGGDSMAISPYAQLGVNFFMDKELVKKSDYVTLNGELVSGKEYDTSGRNMGFLQPAVTLGAWFEMPKKETTTMGFGIEYGLTLNLYNNDYSDSGYSGSVKGEIKNFTGYYTSVDAVSHKTDYEWVQLDYNEKFAMTHSITPSFKIVNEPAENFKFGVSIEVPVDFSIENTENLGQELEQATVTLKNADGTKYVFKEREQYNGGSEAVTELKIAPKVNLGASYTLIPNRFTVNAGVSATPVSITNTVTKNSTSKGPSIMSYYEETTDGVLTSHEASVVNADKGGEDSTRVETKIDSFTANVTAGFVFTFNQNMALDFFVGRTFGIWSNMAGEWMELHGEGFDNDIAKVNILFTLKF